MACSTPPSSPSPSPSPKATSLQPSLYKHGMSVTPVKSILRHSSERVAHVSYSTQHKEKSRSRPWQEEQEEEEQLCHVQRNLQQQQQEYCYYEEEENKKQELYEEHKRKQESSRLEYPQRREEGQKDLHVTFIESTHMSPSSQTSSFTESPWQEKGENYRYTRTHHTDPLSYCSFSSPSSSSSSSSHESCLSTALESFTSVEEHRITHKRIHTLCTPKVNKFLLEEEEEEEEEELCFSSYSRVYSPNNMLYSEQKTPTRQQDTQRGKSAEKLYHNNATDVSYSRNTQANTDDWSNNKRSTESFKSHEELCQFYFGATLDVHVTTPPDLPVTTSHKSEFTQSQRLPLSTTTLEENEKPQSVKQVECFSQQEVHEQDTNPLQHVNIHNDYYVVNNADSNHKEWNDDGENNENENQEMLQQLEREMLFQDRELHSLRNEIVAGSAEINRLNNIIQAINNDRNSNLMYYWQNVIVPLLCDSELTERTNIMECESFAFAMLESYWTDCRRLQCKEENVERKRKVEEEKWIGDKQGENEGYTTNNGPNSNTIVLSPRTPHCMLSDVDEIESLSPIPRELCSNTPPKVKSRHSNSSHCRCLSYAMTTSLFSESTSSFDTNAAASSTSPLISRNTTFTSTLQYFINSNNDYKCEEHTNKAIVGEVQLNEQCDNPIANSNTKTQPSLLSPSSSSSSSLFSEMVETEHSEKQHADEMEQHLNTERQLTILHEFDLESECESEHTARANEQTEQILPIETENINEVKISNNKDDNINNAKLKQELQTTHAREKELEEIVYAQQNLLSNVERQLYDERQLTSEMQSEIDDLIVNELLLTEQRQRSNLETHFYESAFNLLLLKGNMINRRAKKKRKMTTEGVYNCRDNMLKDVTNLLR